MLNARTLLCGLLVVWLISQFTTSAEAAGLLLAALLVGGAVVVLVGFSKIVRLLIDLRSPTSDAPVREMEG